MDDLIKSAILHPKRAIGLYKLHMNQIGSIHEIFSQQAYHWLAEQLRPNTTVIDIGGYIGDTAVYFAQFNEVKKVISYEPSPYTYKLMKVNIEQSGLSKKIEMRNEGIDRDMEYVTIDRTVKDSLGKSLEMMRSKSGKRIKVVTLAAALKGSRNVVIKCDCEGGEEYIFDTEMKAVYAIMLEWHEKKARVAVRDTLIKRGFEIPIDRTNGVDGKHRGYICARKYQSDIVG